MDFIKTQRLRKCFGIGRVTEVLLNAVGFVEVGDLFTNRKDLYLIVRFLLLFFFALTRLTCSSFRSATTSATRTPSSGSSRSTSDSARTASSGRSAATARLTASRRPFTLPTTRIRSRATYALPSSPLPLLRLYALPSSTLPFLRVQC